MRRDDHLVDRCVLVQGVPQGLERIRVDDRPAGGDPRLVQEVERPPQAPLGARAAAVLVDHVARARVVLRRDDRHADRAFGRALLDRLEERPAGDGLVCEDENVSRARSRLGGAPLVRVVRHEWIASTGSGALPVSVGLPFRTACRAPRVPYS